MKRSLQRFLMATAALSSTVDAMTVSNSMSNAATVIPTTTIRVSAPLEEQQQQQTLRRDADPTLWSEERLRQRQRRDTEWHVNAIDIDDDDEDDALMELEVNSFQELQRSTGSEIVDSKLQKEIDQGAKAPTLFLEAHNSDASYLEKIAMASIPQQLPLPALEALQSSSSSSPKQKQRRKSANIHHSQATRVTKEEEQELGRLVQKGVQLYKVRSELEAHHARAPTRAEWTAAAGLDSPSQLRKAVADYRRAKQLLVSSNLGLVHAVVKSQYSQKQQRSGITREELVQEGSLGLLRAAELFDPTKGLRFSTYATIWIKGQLSNSHVAETVRVPQRERTKWNKITRAHDELVQGLKEDKAVEELASHLDISVGDVLETKRKMLAFNQILSLDYEYQSQSRSGDENTKGGGNRQIEGDKNYIADANLAERTQMHADVVAALARNLSPREGRLMRLRYGLTDGKQRTLKDCADAMGISHTYAQNLASKCLKKLREAEEADSLEEYLLTIA